MYQPKDTLERHLYNVIPKRSRNAILYPSFLYSYPNGTVQVPHSDLSVYSDDDEEFLLLVGLHDVTSIIVFPRSHLPDPNTHYTACPLRLSLRPGDILRFHPKLLHCGDRYDNSNLMLHYYVLNSLESLANITIKPEREQLLRISQKSSVQAYYVRNDGKKKKRKVLDEGLCRRMNNELGYSPSTLSQNTARTV